jgi:hypothetical protein
VTLKLHLTDDTQLHAHGFIAGSDLFAEVCWKRPIPDSHLDEGTLWGTPAAMRGWLTSPPRPPSRPRRRSAGTPTRPPLPGGG